MFFCSSALTMKTAAVSGVLTPGLGITAACVQNNESVANAMYIIRGKVTLIYNNELNLLLY